VRPLDGKQGQSSFVPFNCLLFRSKFQLFWRKDIDDVEAKQGLAMQRFGYEYQALISFPVNTELSSRYLLKLMFCCFYYPSSSNTFNPPTPHKYPFLAFLENNVETLNRYIGLPRINYNHGKLYFGITKLDFTCPHNEPIYLCISYDASTNSDGLLNLFRDQVPHSQRSLRENPKFLQNYRSKNNLLKGKA
jgi:hypothetical protein